MSGQDFTDYEDAIVASIASILGISAGEIEIKENALNGGLNIDIEYPLDVIIPDDFAELVEAQLNTISGLENVSVTDVRNSSFLNVMKCTAQITY